MSYLKEEHRIFMRTEEEPFLMFFVYKHIKQLKQIKEHIEQLQRTLVTRHFSYLEEYRPELEKDVYAVLDLETFRSLLKKRKREEVPEPAIADRSIADRSIAATASLVAENTLTVADDGALGSNIITIDSADSSATVPVVLIPVPNSESSKSSGGSFYINNIDISAVLKEIRKNSLALKAAKHKMNAAQILSLNHIYYLSSRRIKSVTRYTNLNVHKALLSHFKVKLPMIPAAVDNLTRRLDEIAVDYHESPQECMDIIEDEILKTMMEAKASKQTEVLVYSTVLSTMIPQIGQWSKIGLGETSFIDAKFSPLALNVFGKLDPNLFNYARQDKEMHKSPQKPDFCLSMNTSSGECLEVYQMEAKAPEANKGNLDFLKLSNNMKNMLDELVSRDFPVEEAKSFGTLLHGDSAFSYEMRLFHEGIYFMNEISSTKLPDSSKGFGLVAQNMQPLLYIKEYITAKSTALEAVTKEQHQHRFQRRSNWAIEE